MRDSESELQGLLLALSQGALDDEQRARLEELVRDDGDARRQYLDYIAVDAMLRFRSGAEVVPQEAKVETDADSPTRVLVAAASIAACVLFGLWAFKSGSQSDPAPNLVTETRTERFSVAGWNLRATPGSEFEISGPSSVELLSGELYAAPGDSDSPIEIQTKSGTVAASGSRFHVETMKIKPLTRLFVIAGAVAVLSNSSGSAEAAPGEIATAEGDETPQTLLADGNYLEAYDIYKRLVVDPEHGGKECADDLRAASVCLGNLARYHELDALLEKVAATHEEDWRVLAEVAQRYSEGPHQGVKLDNKFVRGGSGGEPVNVAERDRIRALQLQEKAMALVGDAKGEDVAIFYSRVAHRVQGNRQLWNLQTLTDIQTMPDLGDPTYWSANGSPPVDEDDNPVFYSEPATWEAAKNDGERWRWLLAQRIRVWPNSLAGVKFEYASFLHAPFGVHTSGAISSPSLVEGELPQEGRFTTHTLKDHETIARLATGVKRFELPDEQRFISQFREVADIPMNEPELLRDLSYKVYHGGSLSKLPDFSLREPDETGELPKGRFDLMVAERKSGESLGLVYDGKIEIPEDGEYLFELHAVHAARLIVDGDVIAEKDGLDHVAKRQSARVILKKGALPIRLEFFSNNEKKLIVSCGGPGFERTYLSLDRFSKSYQEQALDRLAAIYENRRQLAKAAKVWEETIERFGEGESNYRRKRLEQIVGNWVMIGTVPVFTAGEKATLDIGFRNATNLKLRARRVNIEKYIADTKAYLRSDPAKIERNFGLAQIGTRIVQGGETDYLHEELIEWNRKLEPAPDHWRTEATVETPLDEVGVYLVEATADGGNTARVLCWITDTAIAMKRGDQMQHYFIADAVTGAPVSGVNVEVFAYHSYTDKGAARQSTRTVNFSKHSDEQGWGTTTQDDVDDNKYSRIVIARDEESGRFGVLGDFFRDRPAVLKSSPYVAAKAWGVTDRPVYRPGQVVHLKAWVRQARYDLDHVSLFGGREFELEIMDPAGKVTFTKKVRTDEFGGIDSEWQLGGQALLGGYSMRVFAADWNKPGRVEVLKRTAIGYVSFRVEEYKKPEYEVVVEAPDEAAVLGDSIEATIKANYYFGAPVTNAQVKYTVRRTNHADTWFPTWGWDWFYGPGYWWWGYDYSWYPGWSQWGLRRHGWFRANPPEIVQENTVPIGTDGTLKIKIDTAHAKEHYGDSDHSYEITAEVIDESRRTITGKGAVIAARNPFNVSVWMGGGHYRSGAQMEARMNARTPDGKGVKGKGTATLYRVTFDADGNPSEAEAGKWKVETDEAGSASLVMEAGAPGQYRLAYVLRDSKGREREGAALTRILGDDGERAGESFRFNALELVLDKAEYAPGDIAQLLVNTNRADSTVVLFVRPADGVYPRPVLLQMDGKSKLVPIPIEKKDMPNIYVEAFTITGGEIYHATREIIVPPEKRILDLAIEPSEEKYEPGEKAKVKLRLTDADGKPFVGTTVVSIYDKSLEAIAASTVKDIRSYFWKWRRGHSTKHRFSMGSRYYPILRKGEARMEAIGTHWRWGAYSPSMALYGAQPSWSGGGPGWGAVGGGSTWFTHRSKINAGVNYDPFDSGLGELERMSLEMGDRRGFGMLEGLQSDGVTLGDQLGRGTADGGQAPAVRSRFADTALWKATVSTDKNGVAEVELEMPENLTTWKIKAWAMGHGTRVGHGQAEVITSKDIMVRLQAPRFFTESDEVTLSANVHNYTGEKREFEVALEIEGEQLALIEERSVTQAIEIEPGGDQRINWIVRAEEEGEALVRVIAKTDGGKGDAMEQRFPVLVHGILKTDSHSLALREGEESKKIEVRVPEKRRPEQTHLEVRYSPSIALALVDALPHLVHHARKDSLSTFCRFGPLVTTRKILTDIGVDLDAVREKEINLNPQEIGDAKERAEQWDRRHDGNPIFSSAEVDEQIARGLRDLAGLQNKDGGWGWYKGHESTLHMTAYIVHGLQVAETNGAALVPGMLDRGIAWLEAHQNAEVQELQNAESGKLPWKSSADNSDAFTFMVLTDAGKAADAMAEFLYRDRLALSPYCMAMAGLAYDKLEDDEKRDMIIRNLSQFLEQDDENQTVRLALRNRSWRWYWYGNDIEANAYYLKLLCRTGKAKEDTASRLAKYLLNNRKHATYWEHSRDTAVAIEALAEYVRASGEMDPDLEVEVLVDGKSHKKVKISKDNLFSFDGVLELRGDALKTGKHTVEIRRKGKGRLYANAYMTNFTMEDRITKAGLEIKVERRYYKLVDEELEIDAAGSRGHVVGYRVEKKKRIPLADGAEVKSGDLIEVELLIDSKNDYEYLQFSDRKPAGFEAMGTRSGHRWLGGVSAYMELRDERVDFMVQRLRTGKHSLTYRLRAEVPGKFSALPATGDGVYAPELRANSDEFKVKISE